MSENDIENNASESEILDPIEDGQVEDLGEIAEAEVEEELDLFDYTQFADNKVKLQVDGEEVIVPLAEAIAGYQRQADYTRKTQEVSEQRKQAQFGVALQQALEDDPVGTLQMLQQHYGASQEVIEDDDVWTDPAEQQIRSLEQRVAAFEQAKAMEELEKTIDSLQTKYGEDFDPEEVVAKAYATGSDDLEAVFKQIAFDKVYAQAQTSKKKIAEESARTQAKREAAIVSGGNTVRNTAPIKSDAPKSVFEAFEAAKKQLNIN